MSSVAATAPSHACSVCGSSFREAELLLTGRGWICRVCDAHIAEQAATFKGIWRTILGAPFLAFTGSLAFLSLFVLGPAALAFAAFFGAFSVVVGARAIGVAVATLRQDGPALGTLEKVLLFGSGGFGLLWGVGLALTSAGSLVWYVLYTV